MSELLITAKLTMRTALHVGGGEGDDVTAALLRRDAQGKLFIPGSAIAGSLRTLATRLAPRLGSKVCEALPGNSKQCGCWVCLLFGEINPQEGNEQGGNASALWVYDAYPTGIPAIRDGVGIDRMSGAAARQGAVKFDTEVLPAGTSFDLILMLRAASGPVTHERNERLMSAFFAEWQAGRGTLGGRVVRGLGAFTLSDIQWYARTFDHVEPLMAFLRRKDDDYLAGATLLPDKQASLLAQAQTTFTMHPISNGDRNREHVAYAVSRAWVQADLDLQFDGPVVINDLVLARRSGFDHAPLADQRGLPPVWVLPGSSMRGVLRSQAERIARTIATQLAKDKEDFLANCPAGDPNNSHRPEEPLANSDCLLREIAGVKDNKRITPSQLDLGDRLFGSVRLGSRLIVEDGVLVGNLELKVQDFLAIDRFTGGGRDSAKFDAVALWKPMFRVRLRLENPEPWELGWLLLTLRDFHEGLGTVGFGAAKGFGRVKIQDWTMRIGFLNDDIKDLKIPEDTPLIKQASTPTDGIWRVAEVSMQDLVHQSNLWNIAKEWVCVFNQRIQSFRRNDNDEASVPCQRTDSYFGAVDHLYPKKGVVGNG